jgi:ESS family glutamate:Na+ symporter
MGGPLATRLIARFGLRPAAAGTGSALTPAAAKAMALDSEIDTEVAGEAPTAFRLLKGMTVVLVAMWAGSLLRGWLGHYVTLPAYIWSMIIAALLRNADDLVGAIKLDQRVVDDLGSVALSLFLSMALMSLRLWELLDLAIPMLIILFAQVGLMAVFAHFLCFRLMGRDYDAAVMSSGLCGFGLGSTANAVANMDALVTRFGPAPRAFLVVPMVGAFFIDFKNALIITGFMNWFH